MSEHMSQRCIRDCESREEVQQGMQGQGRGAAEFSQAGEGVAGLCEVRRRCDKGFRGQGKLWQVL